MVSFVRDFFEQGKPVAAICHAPWVLVEAGVVRGRKLTSWPTLQTDIRNAGGNWVDQQVVVDKGLVTSRKPDDIPAFNEKMIEEFAEGKHAEQAQKTTTIDLNAAARRCAGVIAVTMVPLGGGSSVGRAPGCGPGGRGFESRSPPSQGRKKTVNEVHLFAAQL